MADDWDLEAVRIRWTSSTLLSGTFRTWRDVRSMSERSEEDKGIYPQTAPTGLIPHPASPHTVYDHMDKNLHARTAKD
jgi:hypothetical protein